MSDYTIAAIPTLYRGRQYRSRTEARWAAFFDLLGWQHEYEPYDLGVWSPDFLLSSIDDDGQRESYGGIRSEDIPNPVLAEIKPFDAFDAATAARMVRALEQSGRWNEVAELLLTRSAPRLSYLGTFASPVKQARHLNVAASIGWIGHVCIDDRPMTAFWNEAFIVWTITEDAPRFVADIGELDPAPPWMRPSWSSVMSARSGWSNTLHELASAHFYPEHTMGVWASATNAVQYHAGARS